MVDWGLARQIARLVAGNGDGVHAAAPRLSELSVTLAPEVAAYTRLTAAVPVPPAETVGRREWAERNLDMLASMLDPVTERLDTGLSLPGALGEPLRAAARVTVAAEAGLMLGYMSQRVLGQYELSLLQPQAPARLVFVGPNLERAVTEMSVDRESFLAWVTLHELTHVFQFSGVAWLRPHLASLIREYLASVEVRISRGVAAGLPALLDPAKIAEKFREGGLAALVQTREQKEIFDRIQATMAVVEGYSEHVMDVVGARVVPRYEGLREAMEQRRRNRSAPELMLQQLLGFQAKLRQYELGKQFCDAVAASGGLPALNHVWSSPEALPTRAEIDAPDRWMARVGSHALPAPGTLEPGAAA